MLDPGSRCLMPSLVSSQFALHCRLIARLAAIRTICLSLLVGAGAAQNTEPAQTQSQQSGSSTGIAHAPVKDALSRPITAGGFVDNAPVSAIGVQPECSSRKGPILPSYLLSRFPPVESLGLNGRQMSAASWLMRLSRPLGEKCRGFHPPSGARAEQSGCPCRLRSIPAGRDGMLPR